MKPEVHQPFGDVFNAYSGAVLECPDVDDAFVCDATDWALVEHGKMRLQTVCHIVGVENGDFGCPFQAISAHECDIGP